MGVKGRSSLTRAILCIACAAVLGSCASIGPGGVLRDRSDYSEAIAESWMRLYLLNIVKMRYLSPPVFIDVGSIVSGYTLETQVGTEVGFLRRLGFDFAELAAAQRFIDRPTVTYTAVKGEAFVARFMTPLRPETLFFTIEAGLPADAMLLTSISAWNGLRNREFSMSGGVEADPRFFRSVELFRAIQLADGIDIRIVEDEHKQYSTLLILQAEHVPEDVREAISEFRELLGLDPDVSEYRLVFGSVSESGREIAVHTRSTLQMMSMMAAEINVPEAHIREGRTVAGLNSTRPRRVRIHATKQQPRDALVAVNYRDHWFWIDDRDAESKRVFSLLMLIFSLADTAEPERLPLITIPTQ